MRPLASEMLCMRQKLTQLDQNDLPRILLKQILRIHIFIDLVMQGGYVLGNVNASICVSANLQAMSWVKYNHYS